MLLPCHMLLYSWLALTGVLLNATVHCCLTLNCDVHLMLSLSSTGSLERLLPGSTGSKKRKWLVCFECDRHKVSPIAWQVLWMGLPVLKRFLQAVCQMDMWNKSKGIGKRSIWGARWKSYRRSQTVKPFAPIHCHNNTGAIAKSYLRCTQAFRLL